MNDELTLAFAFRSLTLEKFSLFDRWGSLLYYTEQPMILQSGQALWSGQVDGKPLPAGVYDYQISVTTPAGEHLRIRSSLTLLR